MRKIWIPQNQKIAVIILKLEQYIWFYYRVTGPKDADRMANSVDPDQTVSLGSVWSGSTLFAQTCMTENLGSLWQIFYNYSMLYERNSFHKTWVSKDWALN